MAWTTDDLASVYRNRGLDPMLAAGDGRRQRKNKFNVAPKEQRTADGIVFASAAEMRHYLTLKGAQIAGLISDLELQPRFVLQEGFTDQNGKRHRAIVYVADFGFRRDGRRVVVDVKGAVTKEYAIKKKLFLKQYPGVIFEEWGRRTR